MSHCRISRIALVACVVLISIGARGRADDHAEPGDGAESPLEKAWSAYQIRLDAIRDEIHHLGKHPWAGEYVHSFMNETLAVAPEHGYAGARYDCQPPPIAETGSVGVNADGTIRLQREYLWRLGTFQELIPIQWSGWRFLVPTKEIQDFCNHVCSSRGDPDALGIGDWYGRLDQADRVIDGLPELLPQYRECLLRKPVHAKILGVVKIEEPDYEFMSRDYCVGRRLFVRINVGRDSGIRVGMTFDLLRKERLLEPSLLTVQMVSEHDAMGIIDEYAFRSGDDDQDAESNTSDGGKPVFEPTLQKLAPYDSGPPMPGARLVAGPLHMDPRWSEDGAAVFLKLTQAEAFKRAAEEKKVVAMFLCHDAYPVSAMMELDVWSDAAVRAWAEGACVPIRVCMDESTIPVLQKYNILHIPTVLFLDPSGRELGRIELVLDPHVFLSDARGCLSARQSEQGR
ncbi:MAG: hypothetical protein H6818_08930 [Phycisphaerales bacterium]|nr:hypothetical protein [Phycisphaerales bacterium]MCB9862694.1 hypothetical protein [Phycisphaerales bacterium]